MPSYPIYWIQFQKSKGARVDVRQTVQQQFIDILENLSFVLVSPFAVYALSVLHFHCEWNTIHKT